MPRSVNAVASRARRKKILHQTKGNFGARGNVYTVAKNTLEKGLGYAYRDRKKKKGIYRGIWIQRINAAVRAHGMNYSEFMDGYASYVRDAVNNYLKDWLKENDVDLYSDGLKIYTTINITMHSR